MILNGKYFILPDDGPQDFKVLFRRLAAVGAGRPVDAEGLPQGPWTPDALAEAITAIGANRKGIELRTVQLWFQDNQKGVSPENVRWLARIFGCGDPDATGDWQRALRASLDVLAENRRADRRRAEASAPAEEDPFGGSAQAGHSATSLPAVPRRPPPPGLAGRSERLFSLGGALNLPAAIFAGATALQFVSFLIGNHSITYVRPDGIEKQVGFQWATNWTFLFMLFLPLFAIVTADLVTFWRTQGRPTLLPDATDAIEGWMVKVRRSETTFWSVLLICLGFAGLVQWIGARLLPLRSGADPSGTDWGSVALARPDVVSVPEAIVFSGFAYLYMAACFYVMFAGLILLWTLADDFWGITGGGDRTAPVRGEVARRILAGLYRCSVAGMLVAVCMIVQDRYLSSDAFHVWAWLATDMASLWRGAPTDPGGDGYGFALHFTSLLVAMPICAVMAFGIVRVAVPAALHDLWIRMAGALAVIVAAYLLTGAFPGFAALLALAVLLGLYGLVDPYYGAGRARRGSEGRHAS